MNPTNQSPQLLAEALARKCAANIHSQFSDEWFYKLPSELLIGQHGETYKEEYRAACEKRNRIYNWTLQSIPIVELLRCVEMLRHADIGWRNKFPNTVGTPYSSVLESLDKKLNQLLREQK